MSQEYLYVLKFMFFSVFVAFLLFSLSIFLVYQKPDSEKISPYECGFNPTSDARVKFDVKFYLIGILFIIFDLEITFLFPWVLTWTELSVTGFFVMYFFLIMLTMGFIFEIKLGAIDLDKSYFSQEFLKNSIKNKIYLMYVSLFLKQK